MARPDERGNTLIETAIALTLLALVAGAALGGALEVSHAASSSPVRDALETAVRRETRVALDVLKYRGARIAPTSVATTLPMPTGSPLPAQLTISTSGAPGQELHVTISATAPDSLGRVTLTTALGGRAPLPGSFEHRPGLAPAPTGAP